MKKYLYVFFAFFSCVGLSQAADKMGTRYMGVDYSMFTYDETGFPEAEPSALRLKAGYFFTDNVAVEGQLGFGIEDDTITSGIPITLELDNFISVLLRGQIPLANTFNIYGVVGMTRADLTASSGAIAISDADTSVSFGVGADFEVSDDMYLNVDYMSYLDETAYDLTAFSVGLRFNF